ncbi:MAG: aldehyde dehydrogenase family protein [Litorimonas sp.]
MYKNYIEGEWVTSDDVIENINPSDTNDVIGGYAQADRAQTEQAVAVASQAFKSWSRSGIQQRSEILDKIGNEILAEKAKLGDLLAREEGKTLPEAIGEVTRAAQIFKFYAGEALRLQGEFVPSTRVGIDVEITREALGVIGIITPWNFPIAIPAWKIAPALAYGNTVVFKPAAITPGSAWELTNIISRSGLPKGVFNLVMGAGSSVGQALLDDKRVKGISFTGSVSIGQKVAESCSRRHAKYQLEMGGKNPLIVLADADMETAVNCAISGAYYSTGQKCTASSRLIVEDSVHDEFVDHLTKKIQSLVVDDARKEGTQIGPVVSSSQLKQNLEYINIATSEGATQVTGENIIERDTPGFYMAPVLFADTDNNWRINQEEVFGPVATTIRASDLDHAINIANDTAFGLSAGLCSQSLSATRRFKQESQAGMVMVNLPTAGVDYHVPFGGTKASSYGSREQGRYAAEFYTSVKTSYIGS